MHHSTPRNSGALRPSRRHFLLAGVTGVGAMALAGTAEAATVEVDDHAAFTNASREYGVPVALLAAMSHAQTRWQDHGGTPSASLGYGPMHLIDGTAADAARARADKSGSRSVDTLGEAATLTGLSEQTLRTDAAANIRGAAAVLAAAQRARGGATGANTDPASWYTAVATTSGLTTAAAQIAHADTVMAAVRSGVSEKLADGTQLRSAARTIGSPEAQRRPLELRVDQARRGRRGGPVDAPRGLDVEWFPAPYEQYGEGEGDYGNHDLANRPRAPKITHIVVHNTEGYFDGTLTMVADPTYVSWQYTLRSSDGHIAQHLKPQDVGWHAGNWYINSHSIGLEHEGFAATGTQWFSEPMYRTSAKLVRHLCKEYRIPIDRAHIIGHDQVPAVADANIPGMHWDPGPFWDWEHYFDLLGAPLSVGVRPTPPKKGDVVRILPGFNGNVQPLSGCSDDGDECAPNVANFVTLRVSPSADAALVNDLGLHQKGQPASTEVSDISARATAGLEFVVAEVKDDWVAIWYLGVKAWFQNPRRRPKAFVLAKRPRTITAAGATGRVYGTCYPEASAYTDPADVVAVKPLLYSFDQGQEYVVTGSPVTDYYKAKTFSMDTPNDHIDIVGKDKYLQITFGHRAAFVRAEEVTSARH